MNRNAALPIIQTALIALGTFAEGGVVIGARDTAPISPMAVISGLSVIPERKSRVHVAMPSEVDVTILLESPASAAEAIEYQMGDLVTASIDALMALRSDTGSALFTVTRSDSPGGPFPSMIDGRPWRVEHLIISVHDKGATGG